AADLLDDSAVLVAHRRRLGDLLNAAVGPEVGSADAARRNPDDGVGGLPDSGDFALFEPEVARSVENGSLHAGGSPRPGVRISLADGARHVDHSCIDRLR